MQGFRDWLASYSITAKSIACVWVFLVVLYGENQAFHNYILTVFNRLPHFAQEFAEGIIIPIAIAIGHIRRAKTPLEAKP